MPSRAVSARILQSFINIGHVIFNSTKNDKMRIIVGVDRGRHRLVMVHVHINGTGERGGYRYGK